MAVWLPCFSFCANKRIFLKICLKSKYVYILTAEKKISSNEFQRGVGEKEDMFPMKYIFYEKKMSRKIYMVCISILSYDDSSYEWCYYYAWKNMYVLRCHLIARLSMHTSCPIYFSLTLKISNLLEYPNNLHGYRTHTHTETHKLSSQKGKESIKACSISVHTSKSDILFLVR